jgi:NAD(P)-dependent dehydrogenase (short-subunit alcohol dehydrogenase family)
MTDLQSQSSECSLALPGHGVIVTGAASGMGRRTAELFQAAGARVLATDISPVDADTPAGRMEALQGDISDEVFVRELVSQASRDGFSAVVHCAGIHDPTGLETTLDAWERVLSVNLRSSFLILKYAIPVLEARGGGSIVLVGSTSGIDGGIVCGPAYASSKAGVHGLTKWAAKRFASKGIRVNAIAPGPIATPMSSAAGVRPDLVPLGRMGDPLDIAKLALYLAGDAGGFVTGQIWSVNGGTLI